MTRSLEPDPLAVRVVAAFGARGLTLATSESLTGGLIGASLTGVPGASDVYLGGVIGYATGMKAVLSDVPEPVLAAHGAVAEETARAMADGVRRRTGADWAVAVTGVAGPARQEGNPPGTVWLAVSGPGRTSTRRGGFQGDRAAVREATVDAALSLLLGELGAEG